MKTQLIVIGLSMVCLCGCRKKHSLTTLRTATEIEMAVNNYLTEYGSMPYLGTADTTILTSTDTIILQVLLGQEDDVNKKSINFLSVREGKENRNGLIYAKDGLSVVGIFDQWGGFYNVRLDLDSDKKIKVHGESLNNRRVAVWSKDRKSVV